MARHHTAIPVTSLGGGTRNDMPEGGGYRYRGIPGWNPAANPVDTSAARRTYTPETLARQCTRCGAEARRMCHGPTGNRLGQPHLDRWAGEEE